MLACLLPFIIVVLASVPSRTYGCAVRPYGTQPRTHPTVHGLLNIVPDWTGGTSAHGYNHPIVMPGLATGASLAKIVTHVHVHPLGPSLPAS
eukprot:SAG31_NODE_9989_length_1200_cov_1.534968_1_plen_91_part_10